MQSTACCFLRSGKTIFALACTFGAGGCGGRSSVEGLAPTPYKIWAESTYYAETVPSASTYINVAPGGLSPTFHAQMAAGFSFASWRVTDSVVQPGERVILPDGTIATAYGTYLSLSNVQGCETIYPVATNNVQTVSVQEFWNATPCSSPVSAWCSSNGVFVGFGSTPTFPTSGVINKLSPTYPNISVIGNTPTVTGIWGVNNQGWVLYQYSSAQGTGVGLLDGSGVNHQITTATSIVAHAEINDSGTVFFGLPNSENGSGHVQYYTQSGWNSETAQPIPSDMNAFLINDAGVIVGTSNGIGTTPEGAALAYVAGQEVPLPNVSGNLAALGNDGTLATVPSPGVANVYTENGKKYLMQIPNFQVDDVTSENAFNRIIGHDRSGHTRILGQSTANNSSGDWGYWDTSDRRFYDVSQEMANGFNSYGYSPLRLWCITDSDQLFASLLIVPEATRIRRKVVGDGAIPGMLSIVAPYGQQGKVGKRQSSITPERIGYQAQH